MFLNIPKQEFKENKYKEKEYNQKEEKWSIDSNKKHMNMIYFI